MTTMSPPTLTRIADLMRSAGLGWRYDNYGPPEQVDIYLNRRLSLADHEARLRFPEGAVRLTVEAVADLAQRAPHKACAFLEQLFGEGEPAMLVMVWRVLAGVDIGRVQFEMHQANHFRLEITLWPDRQGSEEHYTSENVDDVYVVRHFGVSRLNGNAPLFVGFYATRRPAI